MLIRKGPYLQDPTKTSIVIMWETDEETDGEVRVYKTKPHFMEGLRYDVDGEPDIWKDGRNTLHKVCVDGLETDREYFYEIVFGNDLYRTVSERYSFHTAPDESTPFTFVLTAEIGGHGVGTYPFRAPIIERIRVEEPDFIQAVGDMTSRGNNEKEWDTHLFTPFKQLFSRIPYYPCVGNHDISMMRETAPDRYDNYDKYFHFPRNYSYDYGCAHFIVLDCLELYDYIEHPELNTFERVLKPDFENSEIYRFVEKDLAESKATWKFAVFHYPPYSSTCLCIKELRVFAPLFEKYGVDMVFNSHAVVYERTHPIKKDKVDPTGVRYVLVGGYANGKHYFTNRNYCYTAKKYDAPSYVHVAVTPWSLEMQAVDYEGRMIDTITLEK